MLEVLYIFNLVITFVTLRNCFDFIIIACLLVVFAYPVYKCVTYIQTENLAGVISANFD